MNNQQVGRRAGYVLPMTLVLITLAGIVLATASRRSLQAATEARDAEAALRCRWIQTSCAEVVPPRASYLFEVAETAEKAHPISLSYTLTLGTLPVRIVLSDEHAKVNANTLYHAVGPERTTHQLRRLLTDQTDATPPGYHADAIEPTNEPLARLRLRPTPRADRARATTAVPVFGSYDQLFEGASPRQLAFPYAGLAPLSRSITCWSDGRISFRRASAEVIAVACHRALPLDKAIELVAARTEEPGLGLDDILDRLDLDEDQKQTVRDRLTDRSDYWSMWTAIDSGRRTRYRLDVLDRSEQPEARAGVRRVRFTW